MQYFTQNTFQFLKEIRQNNNREWFAENRSRYEAARGELLHFGEEMLHQLMLFDERMREVEKPYLFRIYRDARYAKGIPYKTNMGVLFLKGGKAAMCDRAGYYLHIEPGNCFVGGGSYHPNPQWLGAIRDEITVDAKKLKSIIAEEDFQKFYTLEGERLKTAPRGYAKDHPEIELLRYKSMFGYYPLSDEQVRSPGFFKHVTEAFQAIEPLDRWLNYCAEKAER